MPKINGSEATYSMLWGITYSVLDVCVQLFTFLPSALSGKESEEGPIYNTNHRNDEVRSGRKKLGDYVVMSPECDQTFKLWWRSRVSTAMVSVRCPYEQHGHTGKQSNSAKPSIMRDFLSFVDNN